MWYYSYRVRVLVVGSLVSDSASFDCVVSAGKLLAGWLAGLGGSCFFFLALAWSELLQFATRWCAWPPTILWDEHAAFRQCEIRCGETGCRGGAARGRGNRPIKTLRSSA